METRVKGRVGAVLLAAGLVSMAAGLGVSSATASGEFATVALTSPDIGTSTTFTWAYSFHANGDHELSNIAVKFCSQDVLDHVVSAAPNATIFKDSDVTGGHSGFGHGIKFDVTTIIGTLSITFDQAYDSGPNGIFIQSHSGDGQDGDEIKDGHGPNGCASTTTTTAAPTTTTTAPATTTTVPATTTTVPPTTTTTPPGGGTTTTLPPVTTTLPPVTTTLPPVTTTVPPVTTTLPPVTTTVPPVTTTLPPGSTTTLAPSTTAPSTTIPVGVLGVVERNTAGEVAGNVAADLAKTGSSSLPLLVGLGLALTIAGVGLLVGEYAGRQAN